jgi:hypothetical protein
MIVIITGQHRCKMDPTYKHISVDLVINTMSIETELPIIIHINQSINNSHG